MGTDPGHSSRPDQDKATREMSEAEIDTNLEQTFPSSDPPSWTLGSDHRAAVDQKDEKDHE